ncbi:hypothetical protein BDW72DRAFT_418 [Aspergillus terricola var. indicus]
MGPVKLSESVYAYLIAKREALKGAGVSIRFSLKVQRQCHLASSLDLFGDRFRNADGLGWDTVTLNGRRSILFGTDRNSQERYDTFMEGWGKSAHTDWVNVSINESRSADFSIYVRTKAPVTL